MDKNNILDKTLGKILWKKSENNSSGLLVKTKYPQLDTKNRLVLNYPELAPETKRDIYNSTIKDIKNKQKSWIGRSDEEQVLGPQENWGTIAASYMWNNKTLTYWEQPSSIMMHEQLHNQFFKKNPLTSLKDSLNGSINKVYPRLNESMYEKFNNDYNKYLLKNSNKSSKSANEIKYIEKQLSDFYSKPETSSRGKETIRPTGERYAYLWMTPDLIPNDLKKYYKGVYK